MWLHQSEGSPWPWPLGQNVLSSLRARMCLPVVGLPWNPAEERPFHLQLSHPQFPQQGHQGISLNLLTLREAWCELRRGGSLESGWVVDWVGF